MAYNQYFDLLRFTIFFSFLSFLFYVKCINVKFNSWMHKMTAAKLLEWMIGGVFLHAIEKVIIKFCFFSQIKMSAAALATFFQTRINNNTLGLSYVTYFSKILNEN